MQSHTSSSGWRIKAHIYVHIDLSGTPDTDTVITKKIDHGNSFWSYIKLSNQFQWIQLFESNGDRDTFWTCICGCNALNYGTCMCHGKRLALKENLQLVLMSVVFLDDTHGFALLITIAFKMLNILGRWHIDHN